MSEDTFSDVVADVVARIFFMSPSADGKRLWKYKPILTNVYYVYMQCYIHIYARVSLVDHNLGTFYAR